MMRTKLEDKARKFCERAHFGQTRKDSDEVYHNHPHRVADMLKANGEDEMVVSAAELHDVLEDTEFFVSEFPQRVQELVWKMTNTFNGQPGGKLRAMRKLRGDREAIMIKVADRVDNLSGDGEFSQSMRTWKTTKESNALLLMFAKDVGLGEHPLVKRLEEI